MIENIYGKFKAVCDNCGEEYEKDFDNFPDAVDGAKTDGWEYACVDGEPCNYCPVCKGL